MAELCQCCGMPMTDAKDYGTNADGTLNKDYCTYCYQAGMFTVNCTMDEQIEENLKHLAEFNSMACTEFSEAAAREEMKNFFPTLKRWKK